MTLFLYPYDWVTFAHLYSMSGNRYEMQVRRTNEKKVCTYVNSENESKNEKRKKRASASAKMGETMMSEGNERW